MLTAMPGKLLLHRALMRQTLRRRSAQRLVAGRHFPENRHRLMLQQLNVLLLLQQLLLLLLLLQQLLVLLLLQQLLLVLLRLLLLLKQ